MPQGRGKKPQAGFSIFSNTKKYDKDPSTTTSWLCRVILGQNTPNQNVCWDLKVHVGTVVRVILVCLG